MSDRDTPHKNPARVPMALQAMSDGTAYHEPRNVLGMEGTMPKRTIEKTGIYRDTAGNQFFMAAGDVTAMDVEFSHERGSKRARQAAPETKARKAAPQTKAKAAAPATKEA